MMSQQNIRGTDFGFFVVVVFTCYHSNYIKYHFKESQFTHVLQNLIVTTKMQRSFNNEIKPSCASYHDYHWMHGVSRWISLKLFCSILLLVGSIVTLFNSQLIKIACCQSFAYTGSSATYNPQIVKRSENSSAVTKAYRMRLQAKEDKDKSIHTATTPVNFTIKSKEHAGQLPLSEIVVKKKIHKGAKQTIMTSSSTAIIHIGPRKTGTTAIQDSALHYKSIMEHSDNVILFPHARSFSKCRLWSPPNCSAISINETDEIVASSLEGLQNRNSSFFLSTEELDRVHDVEMDKIRELFAPWDHIQIVYVYRRFFEWFFSLFGQLYREKWSDWNGGGDFRTNILTFFWYTMDVRRRRKFESYRYYSDRAGFDTLMINTHDNDFDHDNIVQTLFCHEELHTPHTCEAIVNEEDNKKKQKEWKPKSNRVQDKEPIAYDEIAIAAFRAGVIALSRSGLTKGKKMTRPEARKAIQEYHEEVMKSTLDDLPKNCLDGSDIDEMKEASLKYEEDLFPTFFASARGKALLEKKFEEYREQGRFCAIDTNRILQDRKWRDFLSYL